MKGLPACAFYAQFYPCYCETRMENIERTPGLIVGWRAIGAAVGRPAQSLAQASSFGKLPVEPIKLGKSVVMTNSMIAELRESLNTPAVDPLVRRVTPKDLLELTGAVDNCALLKVERANLNTGNDADAVHEGML